MRNDRRPWFPVLCAAICACAAQHPSPAPAPSAGRYGTLDRATVNRMAQRLDLPLFWAADSNGDGAIDPGEVKSLLFFPSAPAWTRGGRFTAEFDAAYASMVAAARIAPRGGDAEARRRAAVLADLDQVRPVLVYSDLRGLPDGDRRAAATFLEVARLIDHLYAIQTGAAALAARVPDDPASRSAFRRNWGPRCAAPKTEKDPACSAIPGAPKPKVDAYPDDVQDDPDFCAALEKRPDAKALLAPFVVVREQRGKPIPVPYADAYGEPMREVATRLEEAMWYLGADEKPLYDYLHAAAHAFRDNDWQAADEAWARMNGQNSRYYLRIGPDEVYADPCSQKAGFHMTFARINPQSLAWQDKLRPLQQEMERSLAALIGPPYRERQVAFHLPDFIDIVVNAGDDRPPLGATIGQSLPNWGRVADESRGRTVVMTNLFRDPDSLLDARELCASLLDAEAAALRTDEALPGLLTTILHEATHNLGPAHDYAVGGKTDSQAFGGALASTLEELKAQTGALYFLDLLVKRGVIDADLQRRAYVDAVRWAFGHVARGMWTKDGKRKPYSQLAAIQIGFLMDEGALEWDPAAATASGKDKGAFRLHFEKWPAACEKLMQQVGRIKAANDRAAAETLAKAYVEGDRVPQAIITERVLRQPRTVPVYAVDL
jgi:hypothetical protein